MIPSNWHDLVEQMVEPRYIKFVSGVPVVLTILSEEPRRRMMTEKDGTQKPLFEWNVSINDGGRVRKKVLSVGSKRLLRGLAEQDETDPLMGRTLSITAIGDGFQRVWSISEVQ